HPVCQLSASAVALPPCCTPSFCGASSLFSSFFFQAEDGIRDRNVTGVQTCALPIWNAGRGASAPALYASRVIYDVREKLSRLFRSEERRVGKGCRAREGRE